MCAATYGTESQMIYLIFVFSTEQTATFLQVILACPKSRLTAGFRVSS